MRFAVSEAGALGAGNAGGGAAISDAANAGGARTRLALAGPTSLARRCTFDLERPMGVAAVVESTAGRARFTPVTSALLPGEASAFPPMLLIGVQRATGACSWVRCAVIVVVGAMAAGVNAGVALETLCPEGLFRRSARTVSYGVWFCWSCSGGCSGCGVTPAWTDARLRLGAGSFVVFAPAPPVRALTYASTSPRVIPLRRLSSIARYRGNVPPSLRLLGCCDATILPLSAVVGAVGLCCGAAAGGVDLKGGGGAACCCCCCCCCCC